MSASALKRSKNTSSLFDLAFWAKAANASSRLAVPPADDQIEHVLDYRKVRQIIIDECTERHINLLESLIGKVARRLMQLPGVLGVRVKIVKLEIFDDCDVAISVETG